jgi:Flp pilus assembly protein TadD
MIQKATDLGFSATCETVSEKAASKIERMCRGVLAAAPDHEDAHVFLGLLLLTQRHDVQGARDACRAAFAVSQDGRVSFATLGLRAMVRLAQGDYAGAETDFRTLVAAAGPEDVENIVDDAKRVLENLVEAGAPEDAHHLLAKLQDEFPQQSR